MMDRFEYSTPTMGTVLKLVVYADAQASAERWIDAGLSEIERLMPILNNYSPQSEISRLNARSGQAIEISEELAQVLQHARRWHELSEGVFDITCGALFELWKQARRAKRVPDDIDRKAALDRCGWKHVQLDDRQVTVHRPGLILDVSGLATGYIIDAAIEKMILSGCDSFLMDIGGDIRLGAPPPNKAGWKVDVAGLEKDSPPIMQLSLANCSLTTSGDRNQSLSVDGKSYSHLLNPRTGEPLTSHQSCTAIGIKTVDADAAATTLSILGRTQSAKVFDNLPIEQAILLFLEPRATSDPTSTPIFSRLTADRGPGF